MQNWIIFRRAWPHLLWSLAINSCRRRLVHQITRSVNCLCLNLLRQACIKEYASGSLKQCFTYSFCYTILLWCMLQFYGELYLHLCRTHWSRWCKIPTCCLSWVDWPPSLSTSLRELFIAWTRGKLYSSISRQKCWLSVNSHQWKSTCISLHCEKEHLMGV